MFDVNYLRQFMFQVDKIGRCNETFEYTVLYTLTEFHACLGNMT
jgi:hypothetical protein